MHHLPLKLTESVPLPWIEGIGSAGSQGSVCSRDVKCSCELFVFSHISFLLQQKYFKNTSLEFRSEKHIMWQLDCRGRKWHSGAGGASDLPGVPSKAFCSSLTEFACTASPLYRGFSQLEVCTGAWASKQGLGCSNRSGFFISKNVEVVWRKCIWLPGHCPACRCEFILI